MIIWIIAGAAALGILVLGITGVLILCTGVKNANSDCETIIVLGHRDRSGGFGTTMNERIAGAEKYLRDHPAAAAILSGGHGESAYMHDALVTAGIDTGRLIMEECSCNTWQNLKFSLPLVQGETVGILSSDFHLFRAKLYLKNRKVLLIPVKTKDFPRWGYNFCREIAGVWHYILLGGTYD